MKLRQRYLGLISTLLLFSLPVSSTLAGNADTNQGIQSNPEEQQFLENYQNIIELGQELAELRRIPPSERTPVQQQRITKLTKIERSLIEDYNNFINAPEVQALIAQQKQTSQGENLDPDSLKTLQDNLQQLERKQLSSILSF